METVYNRTVLDLYKKTLNIFKEKHCLFICKTIDFNRALFTPSNKDKLKTHFLTQIPTKTKYPEFYNHTLFNKNSVAYSHWFEYESESFSKLVESESFELRVKLLETIIKNLEENPQQNFVL